MNPESAECTRSFKPSGVYRTLDPIANLRLRVSLWRSEPAVIPGLGVKEQLPSGAAGGAPDGARRRRKRTGSSELRGAGQSVLRRGETGVDQKRDVETIVVGWQEKTLNWFDVKKFSAMAGPEFSPADRSYYALASKQKSKPDASSRRIFTYVDQDEFCDGFRRDLQNWDVFPSARIPKSNLVKFDKRPKARDRRGSSQESSRSNSASASREEVMFIMADLTTRTVGEEDQDSALEEGPEIYVPLCSLFWDAKSRVLRVFPDFTPPGENYALKSPTGQSFHYTVGFESRMKSASELASEDRLFREVCLHHHRKLGDIVGQEFETPSSTDSFRLYFHGQLVEALGFSGRWISVRYLVNLPKGWESDESLLYGCTQSCSPERMDGILASWLNHPVSADLFCRTDNCAEAAPCFFFQVMSTDWWGCQRTEGYGWASIPTTPGRHRIVVKTWRIRFPTLQAEMRRFFLAASTPLADVRPLVDPSSAKSSGRCVSRYGFQTYSAGQLVLELDVAIQESATSPSLLSGRTKFDDALYRSIETVLEAFRKARARMFEARLRLDQTLKD